MEGVETVLDIQDDLVLNDFVPKREMRKTVVDKIKMNHDHSKIGFTVDIGNTERLTAGIKCMETNRIIPNFRLENVGALEFCLDGESVYYTCTDANNRPYKVKKRNISTGEEQVMFIDDNPTHYVDIGLSKDAKFVIISSGTKEDSEIWVIKNSEIQEEFVSPILLIPRKADVRIHIEHLRDFFIIISNNDASTKNFKLQILKDEFLDLPQQDRQNHWEDLLSPGDDDTLLISEFDCFENFIAVYVKENNRPKIIIQDLETKEFNVIEINNGDVGEISPMLNQEYQKDTLRFMFSSPFVYQE